MRKSDELADPTSCLNKAADDEPVFVIRAKDVCAVATILAWINYRIESGKNRPGDSEMREAYQWCNMVAQWRREQGLALPWGG
jgi:hypothetical protein